MNRGMTMKYRKFGRLDWKGSALGFGCMRFPTMSGDRSTIDEPQATRMLHYAIDQGVNYLDTAYGYHGGNSERILGRALQDGYREKVRLATKLPVGSVEQTSDFDRLLNEQLSKLKTDWIDFYLFHGLRDVRWETVEKCRLLEQAEKAIADGRIRYLGFSFHDNCEVFKKIVDAYDWTFCQIQYNFMNEDYQAGTEGLEYAAGKGMAIVVMEPLLGGKLAVSPPAVQSLWDSAATNRTPVEWGLQWLWNKPEVSVVLSGMSTLKQVEENLASADRSGIGVLNSEEVALVAQVRDLYGKLSPIPCTACGYCMPCPNGLDIPKNFSLLNNAVMYHNFGDARNRYQRFSEQEKASSCIECRECEEECPQDIPISSWMPVVHQVIGEGVAFERCNLPPSTTASRN